MHATDRNSVTPSTKLALVLTSPGIHSGFTRNQAGVECLPGGIAKGSVMDTSKWGKKASVTSFFTTVLDRVLGSEVAAPVEKKTLNLAQKQANIRAASVREGFQAILARGDEMAQRIEMYKQQRNRSGESAQTSIDPPEAAETIVLSSTESSSPRQASLARA
jgi:hypothetical protein